MTTNGQNCDGNLTLDRIPAYVQYLTDVISHWKGEGVEFTHVSPMKSVLCYLAAAPHTEQKYASVNRTTASAAAGKKGCKSSHNTVPKS